MPLNLFAAAKEDKWSRGYFENIYDIVSQLIVYRRTYKTVSRPTGLDGIVVLP